MKRAGIPVAALTGVALLASPTALCALQPGVECARSRAGVDERVESTCLLTEHGGLRRTARVYFGRRVLAAAPLLFVLHGGGGSGSAMELLTRAAFNRIADRDGAIIVYPDGVARHWNDGRDLPEVAARENIDDVGFILALADSIAREHPLDRGRIFATGISNGGFMSMRLACDAAATFAAVASVAATLSEQLGPRCHPGASVAVAIVNGTEDPLVPWSGGTVRVLGVSRGTVWSAKRTYERWLELDACRARATDARVDRVADDGTALIVHHGRDCRDGVAVRLYEIEGGGHTWPMGPGYGERLPGRVSQELDATEEIWKFLQANARS